jgi:hypothetical protein
MLTREQIESFKRDGILVLPKFFPTEEIDSWRGAVVAHFGTPVTAAEWRDALRTRRSSDFRLNPDPAPASHAAMAAAYCALHGAIQWAGDSELIIRGGEEQAPWLGARAPHLDFPIYAPIRTLANSVFYLSKVEERGGAFMFWPASHRVAWDYFHEYPDDYLAQGPRAQDEVFERIRARLTSSPVEFIGSAGDLMIWHSLILHSASVNTRPDARLAVFGRWGKMLSDEPVYDFNRDMWNYWDFRPIETIGPASGDGPPCSQRISCKLDGDAARRRHGTSARS